MTPILFVLTAAMAQDGTETPANTDDAPVESGSPSEPASTDPQESTSPGDAPENEGEPTPTDLERAKQLFDNGKTLFEEGNYEDAVRAWQQSYGLSEKPVLLFNIASAAERMGDFDAALEALNTYRAFAKPEERESLQRRMRNLERSRDEQEEARKAEPSEEVETPAPTSVVPAPQPVEPRRRGTGQRVAGGVLIGLGAVGLGSGAVLGVLSNQQRAKATESCLDSKLCLAEAKPALDSSRSLGLGADVSLLAGIVSAGVGTVLVVTAPRGRVSVGVNSIRFDGRF